MEQMKLSYTVHDILAQVDFVVTMDLKRLGEIQLGSIFDMHQILFCMVSGVQDFQFSKLLLSIGSLEYPVIEGYFSPENQDNMKWIVESVFDTY
jgi:hypothetical protein